MTISELALPGGVTSFGDPLRPRSDYDLKIEHKDHKGEVKRIVVVTDDRQPHPELGNIVRDEFAELGVEVQQVGAGQFLDLLRGDQDFVDRLEVGAVVFEDSSLDVMNNATLRFETKHLKPMFDYLQERVPGAPVVALFDPYDPKPNKVWDRTVRDPHLAVWKVGECPPLREGMANFLQAQGYHLAQYV